MVDNGVVSMGLMFSNNISVFIYILPTGILALAINLELVTSCKSKLSRPFIKAGMIILAPLGINSGSIENPLKYKLVIFVIQKW